MAIVNYLGANPIPINIDTNRYQSQSKSQKPDSFNEVLKSEKASSLKAQSEKALRLDKTGAFRKKIGSDLEKTAQVNGNGTDLALKKLASEMEQQFYSIMWNQAFATVGEDFEGGLAEELFRKELIAEMIKGASADEMGELAEAIYIEAKRNEGIKNEHGPIKGSTKKVR
jgi:uncharacterized protein YnzC (UPF0291/DUF896 family)